MVRWLSAAMKLCEVCRIGRGRLFTRKTGEDWGEEKAAGRRGGWGDIAYDAQQS